MVLVLQPGHVRKQKGGVDIIPELGQPEKKQKEKRPISRVKMSQGLRKVQSASPPAHILLDLPTTHIHMHSHPDSLPTCPQN